MRRVYPTLVLLLLGVPQAGANVFPDLSKVEKRLVKEPAYHGKPGYLYLVLGAEAKHGVWLVLDGDTLYVDRHGDGDLTKPDGRVAIKTTQYQRSFEAGDLAFSGQRYTKLLVALDDAKGMVGSDAADAPAFKDFLAANPAGKLVSVGLDVPLPRPFPDVRDGAPIKTARQYAGPYDARGILRFAAKPQDAPVIHFGGRWTFAPDFYQRLLRGRKEEITVKLGTPGHGPGSFASLVYDLWVPASAKPRLTIRYPSAAGQSAASQQVVLEDRC